MNTDLKALAQEALDIEGASVYFGATTEQLAEFLEWNPEMWDAATPTMPWTTTDGFDRALQEHLGIDVDAVDDALASIVPITPPVGLTYRQAAEACIHRLTGTAGADFLAPVLEVCGTDQLAAALYEFERSAHAQAVNRRECAVRFGGHVRYSGWQRSSG